MQIRPGATLSAIAPGLLTAFGETQHPDEAARLFDRFLHASGADEDQLKAIDTDEPFKDGLVAAFGSFGAAVTPLLEKTESASVLFERKEEEAPRDGRDFLSRFVPPKDPNIEEASAWRRDAIANIAFLAGAGRISFDTAAESLEAVQEETFRNVFNAVCKKTPGAEQLSLYVFDGPARGAPGVTAPLGFVSEGGSAETAETAARAFLDAIDTLGKGIFAVTPDVAHRPGGVSGPIAPDTEAFKSFIRSEAVAQDYILLARGRVIAGPDESTTKALRTAVSNPRRADILFRDLDRARAQRLRRDRANSLWDLDHAEGGLHDVDLIIGSLIYRHAAAQPAVQSETPDQALDLLARAGAINVDVAETLKSARAFWTRMYVVRALAGWSDPQREPVRRRFAGLLARAAEVENFSAVRPMMRGYADEITRLYAQLVLGRPSVGLVASN